MVVLSFVKYGNIHNAINFTFSIPCDAYLDIVYGLLRTFSSGPLRFCQQKHFSSFSTAHNCLFPPVILSSVYFLCHQHLCCVAYRDCFVIQFCGVSVVCIVCRHTVFRTVSKKWLVRFNSNLAYGCNWS